MPPDNQADTEMTDEVLYEEIDGCIALITLNRPAKRNAINVHTSRTLATYVERTEENPAIRAVILQGAGNTVFCAGADLDDIAAGIGEQIADHPAGMCGLIHAQRRKPWVAAVRGAAVGGGTELALACDLIIAGKSASFCLPEVRHGMLAGAAGAYRLVQRIAPPIAMELLLTGTSLGAERAAQLGLVNHLVADDQVIEQAIALARQIAANAPLAVSETLMIARQSLALSEPALRAQTTAAGRRLAQSEDILIGIRAIKDKRKPEWTGR